MTSIPCPKCRAPLTVPESGAVTCAKCGARISLGQTAPAVAAPEQAVPAKPAQPVLKGKPLPASAASAPPPLPPPPPSPPLLPLAPDDAVPPTVTLPMRVTSLLGSKQGLYGLMAVAGGVVAMVVLLIILQPRGPDAEPGSPRNQPDAGVAQRSGDERPDDKLPAGTTAKPSGAAGPEKALKKKPKPPSAAPPPKEPRTERAPVAWAPAPAVRAMGAGAVPRIDGVPAPAGLVLAEANLAWTLLLAPGQHLVAAAEADTAAQADAQAGFPAHYRQCLQEYREGDRFSFERLVERSRESAGVFREPLLPHLWGNYYWEQEDSASAVRYWNWAIRLEPAFAPAHVNLAWALLERGDKPRAARQTALAASFNFQNAYGVDDHVLALREKIGFAASLQAKPQFHAVEYLDQSEPLNPVEYQVVDALETLGSLASTAAGRAQALNNAGVYVLHEARKPLRAVSLFRRALEQLVQARSLAADRTLADHLLKNLEQAADQAQLPERKLYARLRER